MFYKQLNYFLMAVTVCLAVSIILEVVNSFAPFATDLSYLAGCVVVFAFGIRLSHVIKDEQCFQEGIVPVSIGWRFFLVAIGLKK